MQDTTVAPKGAADELAETTIDLRPALKDGLGHVIVLVEPTVQPKERWRRQRAVAWVEATRIGLDAFVDDQRMTAWATRLTDGQPLAGVTLSLSGDTLRKPDSWPSSDRAGVATMDLPEQGSPHRLLVARQGADVAFLPQDKYWWNSGDAWHKRARRDTLRWCVFDDRGIYKPNETVHFKGWMRILAGGPAGDIRGLDGSIKVVHYRVLDSRGNEVGKGDVPVNAQGGFDGSFKLPDNLNLGRARLLLSADASALSGSSGRARVPGGGVPPSRVRGDHDRSAFPVHDRRPRPGRHRGEVLRGGRPGQRRRDLERDGHARQLLPARPRRVHLRPLGALVLVRRRRQHHHLGVPVAGRDDRRGRAPRRAHRLRRGASPPRPRW